MFALVGCVDRHLYHYHRTVIGVDIAASIDGETPRGHLILGYARKLVVVVPPSWELTPTESEKLRARSNQSPFDPIPSTVFCTQVKAGGRGVNLFREIMATGDPATNYAAYLVANGPAVPDASKQNFVCPDLAIEVPKP